MDDALITRVNEVENKIIELKDLVKVMEERVEARGT